MERIGSILKEKRIEKGLSLEDMSKTTKLSTIQLEAIEEGNIQFFKEDLSYLSYFVRYYANALGVSYDELRDDLDDTIHAYTDSITVSQIQKQDEITTNIRNKVNPNANVKVHRAKKSRRFDFGTVGLVVLGVAIVTLFGYLAITYVVPMFGSTDPIEKPVITVPKVEEEEKPAEGSGNTGAETTPETNPNTTVTVNRTSPTEYAIAGWEQGKDVTLDFTFNATSWMQFEEDGKIMTSPASGTYPQGQTAKVTVKPSKNKKIEVQYGAFKGNTIKVNGVDLEIDPSIAPADVVLLTFTFIEGATQS
ncbi:helix-turn-helix domain-containing protein [Erysipelothrix aquatica]|uniref:helix-turn-helix domain-containing protein n=1 Tax=Erysipelothrix aquatica TaxID=2683714 RepID=UPI00135CB166|nr:helix-turn-helix domain-containing protein [Erysipelothrix aquatica]